MALFIVEFDLSVRSSVTVEDGDVIVDRGYSTVTVRNVEADSIDDAANKARAKANALLDELCRQYEIKLEIENGYTVLSLQELTERLYLIPHHPPGNGKRKSKRLFIG